MIYIIANDKTKKFYIHNDLNSHDKEFKSKHVACSYSLNLLFVNGYEMIPNPFLANVRTKMEIENKINELKIKGVLDSSVFGESAKIIATHALKWVLKEKNVL